MATYLRALFTALAFNTPIFAQEKNDTVDSAIIVIGQRDRPIEIEPRGLAMSLGDEQFSAVNAFNTEDLMKYAPNFFVRKRYAGDSNGVPGFRGTHSTQSARTLVMVDGFVVSNFLGNSFGFAPKWGVVGPGEVQQFDIVYGPYSARYAGNSMGGLVNITTRDPKETEAFATVQSFLQPYRQYSTNDDYFGYAAEAGVGLKHKDSPFSVRLTARYFRNDGHPQTFYGLAPAIGAPGVSVTGAVTDPKAVAAITENRGIARSPGTATNPIFAAQAPAETTQQQIKLKAGYDDGRITGQALFAFWRNADNQSAPDCYLRDAAGNIVCEGRVTFSTQAYTASGANLSITKRDEYLAGLKLASSIGDNWNARLALSTYRVTKSEGFTSNGFVAGNNNGAGTLTKHGPTGWYTGDLTLEHKSSSSELALGLTGNLYQTNQTRFTTTNWRTGAGQALTAQTFGKTRMLSAWAENRVLMGEGAITFGMRYDNWRAFDGGIGGLGYNDRSQDAISPKIAGELKLANDTLAQLSLARATRFPTVGELFQGSLNGDGTFNINSFDPNLQPEQSYDLNALVSHDFGKIKLTGSFFFQRVDDTIFSFVGLNQNGVSTSSFKNIDRTRQYGFEAIFESRALLLDGLDIDANLAYTDSKTLINQAAPAAEGVQFPRIPKWRINGNIRYNITSALRASLGLRYASRPNTDLFGLQSGDTFGFTSELFALDVKLNWALNEHFRIAAGVDNLTNNRAWVFHPYPQRSFLIEAGWKL
jgi:iron complex outermembrane recepter protein